MKLFAGPNHGLIDQGVKLLTSTFGGVTAPTKDNFLAAVNGLIGPLTKLPGWRASDWIDPRGAARPFPG